MRSLFEVNPGDGGGTSGSPGWRPPPELPQGLSIGHKWPASVPGDFLVSIARGGNCVHVRQVGEKRPRPEGAERGHIHGFSRSSRLNLQRVCNSIDRRQVSESFFATNTVPRGEADWPTMERHRRAWLKRFDRQWPDQAFVVWKKELHRSGTVHLHALIFWVKSPPRVVDFRAWNDNAWADVVKSPNPAHRRSGCNVQRMNSWNGVTSYAAKYLAKDQVVDQDTGRIWGVHNRALAAISVDVQHVPPAVGVKARRVLRKLQRRRRESWWAWSGGKWNRLRQIQGGLSVSDQVRVNQAAGIRVKRSRPKCCSTRTVQIWGQVEGTCRIEPLDQERHTFAAAMHFVREGTARHLLTWAMSEWLRRLEEDESLPF